MTLLLSSNGSEMSGGFGLGGLSGRSPVEQAGFPDPFTDMASLAMPETMNYALRWCWLPGYLVELDNFQFKPIEDIRPGDKVRTRLGTIERVKACSAREVDEEVVCLEVAGLGKSMPICVTAGHNLPSVRPASTLKPNRLKLSSYPVAKRQAKDLQAGDWLTAPVNKLPETREVEYSSWLLGMYAAEGCGINDAHGNRIGTRFTLGADDERTGILQKLIDVLDLSTHKVKPHKAIAGKSKTTLNSRTVTSHDKALLIWMPILCPGRAKTKSLAPEVFEYNRQELLALVAGWIDGDGCLNKEKDGTYYAGLLGTTSSEVLAYQMFRLCQSLGLNASLCKVSNKHSTYGGGNSWQLKIARESSLRLLPFCVKLQKYVAEFGVPECKHEPNKSHQVSGNDSYYLIKKKYTKPYKGLVYNFEVETEHSYNCGLVSSANCQYIAMAQGTYRQALDRTLSYFITDVEACSKDKDKGLGDQEKNKVEDFFRDQLGISKLLHTVGLDYLIYGNCFTSVILPFKRYLYCPKCYLTMPLREIYNNPKFAFQWRDFDFHAKCPKSDCGYSGRWGHVDRRGLEEDIVVKRWNPLEMEILWDPFTDNCSYIWKIPEEYKKLIREGHLYHLERANWEIIQAIKNNRHMHFDDDVIFHLKEDALAGIRNRGWGIPRTLTNFRQVWYVQVLHRYNEAIALDYVIPFRLITPVPQGGGGGDPTTKDPLLNMNLGGFMGRVRTMLREHRRDPAMWHTLPFPIQYQALGGDATQLAPRELLDQGLEVLLTNVGIPVELYKGSLQIQAAPAALRLFESNWSHLVHNLNRFLKFLATRLAELLSWEPAIVKLTRVTHADDLNKQMAKMQLMMGGGVSKTTGLKSINVDYKEEIDRQMDEARYEAQKQEELEEDMKQMGLAQEMSQSGQPQPGGDPNAQGGGGAPPPQGGADQAAAGATQSAIAQMPIGPNQRITPEELQERAQTLAQQLMGMPENQRQSEMTKLKSTNPTLHSLVKVTIENIRQQARTQGGSQVIQQQFGGT